MGQAAPEIEEAGRAVEHGKGTFSLSYLFGLNGIMRPEGQKNLRKTEKGDTDLLQPLDQHKPQAISRKLGHRGLSMPVALATETCVSLIG